MTVKRATLKDVAKRAGIHISTASRALDLRTRHLISPDVTAKVVKAAQQLGYRHNQIAASLRTKKSHSIGIVIPDITNMLFPPIIRGIEDRIVPHGYLSMIGHTDGNIERERGVIEALQTRGIDGLIVASAYLNDDTITSALDQGTPVVTVNRRVKDEGISSVVSDDKGGIGVALAHLVSLGHRSIGYLSGPVASSTGDARLNAFRYWARDYGVAYSESHIVRATAFRESEGARCADILLAANPKLTAIVCAADLLAIGAIATLKRRGINCPKDISITGFNDVPFADRLSPALTTVRVEHYQCGSAAAGILLDDLQAPPGQQTPRHIVLPVSLVVRESTGPAPKTARRKSASRQAATRPLGPVS
jgi:LacI family transcriptional regulator